MKRKSKKTRVAKPALKTKTSKANLKAKKKKLIAASMAAGTAAIIGYFGWQYLKKKRQAQANSDIDTILKQSNNLVKLPASSVSKPAPKPTVSSKTNSTYSSGSQQGGSDFPLKNGSKGEPVRQLQEALINRYGKSILPKYGADGDFGSETTAALRKLGYPSTIDQSTFNVITAVAKGDAAAVGKELYTAAKAKNYAAAIGSLKKLKSTEDYAKANEVFKTSTINGVRQTIVNGLLNTFASASQKDAIKMEFLRMGLQYDGSQWSLSGLDGTSLITVEPTTIWVNAKESMNVPARMVLGSEVSRRLDYTLFENNGKYFLVNTKSVKTL